MKKVIPFIQKRKYQIAIAVVVLLAIYFLFFHSASVPLETMVVHRADFLQQVSVSGKVVAAHNVNIATPDGGVVSSIFVKVGDKVFAGAKLLSIDAASLEASLRSAQSAVNLKHAEIANSEKNIEKITKEQDTLVKNAYNTLLSENLEAVPESVSNDIPAPTITGSYAGAEGSYKIHMYPSTGGALHEAFYISGLEDGFSNTAAPFTSVPLGSKGLYIQFRDNPDYGNSVWTVSIPNTRASTYAKNKNAYEEAKATRSRVIADAEQDLAKNDGVSVLNAELDQAEAEVNRIMADIADRTPRAPFSGLITRVDTKVGETVSGGETVVGMISSGAFQIESYVPEINVALLKVNDEASITLDAYGDGVPFEAKVISIDPAETLQDGVSTYKAVLQFNNEDDRIKSGMTANVVITTEQKSEVIAVPQGIVVSKDGKKFITVLKGNKEEEIEVNTGAVSSLGQIEITTGLNDGDVVVLPPPVNQ